jgi:hypothetical protein
MEEKSGNTMLAILLSLPIILVILGIRKLFKND